MTAAMISGLTSLDTASITSNYDEQVKHVVVCHWFQTKWLQVSELDFKCQYVYHPSVQDSAGVIINN